MEPSEIDRATEDGMNFAEFLTSRGTINIARTLLHGVSQAENTGQQNSTIFLFVPRTSIDELSSTFYAEFRYVYRIFLSGRISKIQRNLNVQKSTLRANETGRNFFLKCTGV